MTTIATDGVSIAGDSLAVSGDLVSSKGIRKIWRFAGDLYGGSGLLNDIVTFQKWQNEGSEGEIELSESFGAIKVTKRGVYFFDNALHYHKANKLWATGSGREIALGAMYAGASAHTAVRIASRLNVGTGGPIRVLYLE